MTNSSGNKLIGNSSACDSGVTIFNSLQILSSGLFVIEAYGGGLVSGFSINYTIINFIKNITINTNNIRPSAFQPILINCSVFGDDDQLYIFPINITLVSSNTNAMNSLTTSTSSGFNSFNVYSSVSGALSVNCIINSKNATEIITLTILKPQLIVTVNETVRFI